jgi:hypothetical protein
MLAMVKLFEGRDGRKQIRHSASSNSLGFVCEFMFLPRNAVGDLWHSCRLALRSFKAMNILLKHQSSEMEAEES